MRIEELSVGDRVSANGVAKRVYSIDYQNGEYFVHFSDPDTNSEDYMHAPFVEPIPLTAEILEKNGFVKCGRCCTSRTTAYIKDFTFVNHLEERKAWRVKIYGEEGLVELCSILVHHTHQLQHALRLAGVEKEIEL